MDDACIKFSRAFYQALFSECKTPCESFNIAQQTLSISPGLEGQSALFIMKTNRPKMKKNFGFGGGGVFGKDKKQSQIEEEHKCKNHRLLRGKVNRVDKNRPMIRFINNLPSKPEPFVGRNQDVRQVLKILREGYRLITLTGEPGIGKTAVAKAVVHYLKDRDEELIKNGASFLNIIQ